MSTEEFILIVDDTPKNLELLSETLQNAYRVKAAASGKMALKIAKEKKPNLILLDVMMPEMDGYAVIKELKCDPSTKEIPVIFVTAKADIEDEKKGFELGAVDYITKPISPQKVKMRVKTHILLQEKSTQLEEKVAKLERVISIFVKKIKRVETPKDTKIVKTRDIPLEENTQIKDFTEYFLDDHINDLADYEIQLDSIVNRMFLQENISNQLVNELATIFKKYGEILSSYPIFLRLGYSFQDFSQILLNKDFQPTPENLSMAINCTESLLFTLESWRERVFSGEMDDPNSFDNSIISDIETIGLALQNKLHDLEGDVDFF